MAQVMAHRQTVVTKIKLTQKQSTETVQVMLYTSASMLFRIRGIFPALAFDTVEFAEDDELYTFKGLLNNEHPSRRQPSSPSSTSTRSSEPTTLNVPLLKRGRSVRVDQFLDSLDTAFEALHRGTLHALRIPFLNNPEVETNSLELWAFRVIYNTKGEREVQSLETSLGNEDVYDPSLDIHGSVISLLRRVYDQCGELPQLPDDCYIQPSILYKQDGWEPKGYLKTQSRPSVQGFPGWQPHTADLGLITGHHHKLALRIASLQHEHSSTRRMSQDLRSRKPEDHSPTRTPTLSNGRSPMQPRTFSPTQSRRTSAASAIPDTPQDAIQSDRARASSVNPTASTPAISEQLPHSSISSASQIDDDVQRRSSLDNMLMPSPRREDNVETQTRTNASQIINNSSADPELAEHMKTYDFLTSETAYRLWGATCELQKRPTATLVNTSITSCRCQLHDLTEEMTRCSICGVQQHSICQGYLDAHNHQPPQHVCHLCLLGRMVDRATLARLCELALERRIMDLLLSKEVDSAVDLSRKLADMQSDKVARLVTSLGSQGFVVEQGGRSTRNSPGTITFPDVVSTPEYIGSLAKLFDPYQVVGHLFSGAMLSGDPGADVVQALRARYPILVPPSRATVSISPEQKRSMTANASKKMTPATKKRARTSQSEGLELTEQATPVRQSPRLKTPTPQMNEAKFGFFINTNTLPSRDNPGIKSKRFKGGS